MTRSDFFLGFRDAPAERLVYQAGNPFQATRLGNLFARPAIRAALFPADVTPREFRLTRALLFQAQRILHRHVFFR